MISGYNRRLLWQVDGTQDDPSTYVLDTDHPQHQANMANLTRLERDVLRAHLRAALRALELIDGEAS